MTTIQSDIAGAALNATAATLGSELGLMSSLMSVSLGQMLAGQFQPSGKGFTASMPSSGHASVNLGDGNTLSFDKSSSQMQITDAHGNVTTVYGDPHLLENGTNVGQFKGPMTFELKDGTKITVDTKPGTEGSGVAYADRVTITRGSNAVVVQGLDQESSSSLSISSSENGYALDGRTADGFTVDQAAGGQWINSMTGRDVTGSDLTNMTTPGAEKAIEFGQAFGQLLGGFLATGLISSALASFESLGEASSSQGAGGSAARNPLEALGFLMGFEAGSRLASSGAN